MAESDRGSTSCYESGYFLLRSGPGFLQEASAFNALTECRVGILKIISGLVLRKTLAAQLLSCREHLDTDSCV